MKGIQTSIASIILGLNLHRDVMLLKTDIRQSDPRCLILSRDHFSLPDEKFANGFAESSLSISSSPCSRSDCPENMSKLLLSFIFLKLTASMAFDGSGIIGGVICRNSAKLIGLKNA